MDLSGLNQVNEALTRFGSNLYEIGMAQKREDDKRNHALGLLEFHTWATDQTNAALMNLANRPYTDLWTEDGNQGEKVLADLQTQFQGRYQALQGKRPNLALDMQKVADGLIGEAKQKYAGVFEKKKIDHYLGVYQTNDEQLYKEAVSTFDPKKRAEVFTKKDAILLTLVEGNVMPADTASRGRI